MKKQSTEKSGYKIILLLFTVFLLLPIQVFADWKYSFYTDDSPYYLKLKTSGFIQRFRIHQNDCNDITNAYIEIQGNNVPFKKQKGKWKNLFGINEGNYCWYEAEVKNLDFNSPKQNNYHVVLMDTWNKRWYFHGPVLSILPKNRISDKKDRNHAISPGTEGATPTEGGGVFFKIWEPDADEVHLFVGNKGPFKLETDRGRNDQRRSHIIHLPWVKNGATYRFKFLKNGRYESLRVGSNNRVSEFKVDPMARKIIYDSKGGKYDGYLNVKAVVDEIPHYSWKNDLSVLNLPAEQKNNWLIYQLWPMSFNPKQKNSESVPGTFKDIMEKSDYLESLGITAVELLPVHEFRLKASWGYMLDSIRLIETTYGTPHDLMELVDNLHGKKIRVVLDVVLNHVNNSLIRDPINEHEKNSKFYSGDTGWGPKPRFSSVMVRKWIMDSLIGLVREYHVDGFRFDMIKYIYQDNKSGYQFLQELNTVLKMIHPEIHLMAEELPDNAWTTFPVANSGLAYDSQWSDLFKNFFEKNFDHYRPHSRNLDMGRLLGALYGFSNHEHHKFGHPLRTVNFLGSHDFVGNRDPIIRIVSDYLSTESVGTSNFYMVRPLSETHELEEKFRLIHNHFTHSLGRLAYGILFTKPGNLLFFQGEELASDINIQNEWDYIEAMANIPTRNMDLERFITSHKMPWEYLNPENSSAITFLNTFEKQLFKGYNLYFRDMISFRKNNPGINNQEAYNVRLAYDDSVISYQIKTPSDEYFIIGNFGWPKSGAWIPFPAEMNTWWREIINSSVKKYGGETNKFTNILSQFGGRSNLVRIEGPSITIFKKERGPAITRDLFLVGTINNWSTEDKFKLKKADSKGEKYHILFNSNKQGLQEFKLSTTGWEIEMGSSSSSNTHYVNHGQLSYLPSTPNIRVHLEKAKYEFEFNLKTFDYKFKKLQ
ncbi:MAG: hypothetical protein KAQ98_08175 [Bacteriovoracaceae bacterium]|nr:hypothetical protein [Bacteriovoracaceae bacterium]